MTSRARLMLSLALKKGEVSSSSSQFMDEAVQNSLDDLLNNVNDVMESQYFPSAEEKHNQNLIASCEGILNENQSENLNISYEEPANENQNFTTFYEECSSEVTMLEMNEDEDLISSLENTEDINEPGPSRKPKKNTRKENAELRMRGKAFLGFSKSKPQKKTIQNKIREARVMGERCKCKVKPMGIKTQCHKVSNDERKIIFDRIWENLNWEERKAFVCTTVTLINETERQRRKNTLQYFLKISNGSLIRVCKKMYIATTGIREWSVLNWLKRSKLGIKDKTSIKERPLEPKDSRLCFMQEFLENLNKLPSHYCRKNTAKLYLEQNFQSVMEVYRAYIKKCHETKNEILSHIVMRKLIKESNIGLYRPKKDWCDICFKFKSGELLENEYEQHLKDKNRSREEKERDKTNAENSLCHVLTIDVQAVKVCPSINASALYYRTKLCCHNFTVYNLVTKIATCYWFDETVSDGQASTFASFLLHYLEKNFLESGSKIPIIIFSDGCTAQNRNSIMSNALLFISEKYQVEIIQKYLTKGHTQMECDSVHSTIENKLKNKEIYIPNDYVRLTKEAKVNKPFYQTEVPSFDFFKNYGAKEVLKYSSIRPGKKTNDPCVTNVKSYRYFKGTISYKLDFDDQYENLPTRPRKVNLLEASFEQLHSSALKIPKKKFCHLQEIKAVIPRDYWPFYDSLQFKDN